MKATKNPETNKYATMGMAALLPGMVHMLELMQAEVDQFRTQLAALQQPAPKRGRPRMSEKALENKRRIDREAKRRQRALEKTPQSPGVQSEAQRRSWAAMSPAKRKKRVAAMLAGRQRKAEVVKLEKVA